MNFLDSNQSSTFNNLLRNHNDTQVINILSIINNDYITEDVKLSLINRCIKSNNQEFIKYIINLILKLGIDNCILKEFNILLGKINKDTQIYTKDWFDKDEPKIDNKASETEIEIITTKCKDTKQIDYNSEESETDTPIKKTIKTKSFKSKKDDKIIKSDNEELIIELNKDEPNFSKIVKLIDKGYDVNTKCTKYGDTALIKAARKNYSNYIIKLIERDADVNIQNFKGKTALYVAINNTSSIAIYILIKAGADPNIKNIKGNTTLHRYYNITNISNMSIIINAGADINVLNNDGLTPLLKAVYENNINMITILLSNEANIFIKDEKGKTALDIAKKYNYKLIIKRLEIYIKTITLFNNNLKEDIDEELSEDEDFEKIGKLNKK